MKVLNNGYVELTDHMGDDLRIINAARKSFNKESLELGEKDAKLLKYLWDNNHTSPFEMVEFLFEVKAPLFVVRQWQRHRTWSYNEVSRRYTSEDLDFYFPEIWRKQSEDNRQSSKDRLNEKDEGIFLREFPMLVNECLYFYENMIENGVCREQARMVLPQNMMVKFVAKVDLKNLLDFLILRLHPHAQWEIQQYAKAIVELITPVVPETMKLFTESRK